MLAPAWQEVSSREAKQIAAGEPSAPTNTAGLSPGVSDTATEPLVPAAVQWDEPEVPTHETPEKRSSWLGLESATQFVPVQDSISEPAAPAPTATQRRCEAHEMLTSSEGLVDEVGFRTMDHESPSNDSVKAMILTFLEVISPSAPTAAQNLGDTHETPNSASRFCPVRGLVIFDHCLPFQDSISGSSVEVVGEVPSPTEPTATQKRVDTQDTPTKDDAWADVAGPCIVAQVLPFQDSISGSSVSPVLADKTASPTATQNVIDTHETWISSPSIPA